MLLDMHTKAVHQTPTLDDQQDLTVTPRNAIVVVYWSHIVLCSWCPCRKEAVGRHCRSRARCAPRTSRAVLTPTLPTMTSYVVDPLSIAPSLTNSMCVVRIVGVWSRRRHQQRQHVREARSARSSQSESAARIGRERQPCVGRRDECGAAAHRRSWHTRALDDVGLARYIHYALITSLFIDVFLLLFI